MKLASKEDMEFNIRMGVHPHRTHSLWYWTRILMPMQENKKKETNKMANGTGPSGIGAAFIQEMRAKFATESKKAKWHRSVQAQTYHNGTAYVSKTFILNRYLKEIGKDE